MKEGAVKGSMKDATPEVLRPQNVWQSIEKMTELLAKEGISKEQGGSGEIKYKFRGIDDIRNATAPLMKECALVVTPRVTRREEKERTTKSGGFALWVVLNIDFELVNTIDFSKTSVPIVSEAVDYSDKATQKAMSQAYKTMAINTFNIPTEGEQDTDGEEKEFKPGSTVIASSENKVEAAPTKPEYRPSDPLRPYKDEYVIPVAITPEGTLNFDEFAAILESKVQGAKSPSELSMWNRANAKSLKAMEKERPDLFKAIGEQFVTMGNALK